MEKSPSGENPNRSKSQNYTYAYLYKTQRWRKISIMVRLKPLKPHQLSLIKHQSTLIASLHSIAIIFDCIMSKNMEVKNTHIISQLNCSLNNNSLTPIWLCPFIVIILCTPIFIAIKNKYILNLIFCMCLVYCWTKRKYNDFK